MLNLNKTQNFESGIKERILDLLFYTLKIVITGLVFTISFITIIYFFKLIVLDIFIDYLENFEEKLKEFITNSKDNENIQLKELSSILSKEVENKSIFGLVMGFSGGILLTLLNSLVGK